MVFEIFFYGCSVCLLLGLLFNFTVYTTESGPFTELCLKSVFGCVALGVLHVSGRSVVFPIPSRARFVGFTKYCVCNRVCTWNHFPYSSHGQFSIGNGHSVWIKPHLLYKRLGRYKDIVERGSDLMPPYTYVGTLQKRCNGERFTNRRYIRRKKSSLILCYVKITQYWLKSLVAKCYKGNDSFLLKAIWCHLQCSNLQ